RAGQAQRGAVGARPRPRPREPGGHPGGDGVRRGVPPLHARGLRGVRPERRPVHAHDARRPAGAGGAGADRARAERRPGRRPAAMIARERTALATRPVARRAARLGPLARRRERWFYLLIAPWLLGFLDRKSTRLNSSHVKNSYAVFCLK